MKVWRENCKACPLYHDAKTVGMQGIGAEDAVLMVFLDFPSREDDYRHRPMSPQIALLQWLLAKMSLSLDDVRIEFTLKCHKPKQQLKQKAGRLEAIEQCSKFRFAILQKIQPKAVVGMGRISTEAFLRGADQAKKQGWKWDANEIEVRSIVKKIWITYSPAYPLENAGEIQSLYRVLYRAAENAGLKPKPNQNVKPFPFEI